MTPRGSSVAGEAVLIRTGTIAIATTVAIHSATRNSLTITEAATVLVVAGNLLIAIVLAAIGWAIFTRPLPWRIFTPTTAAILLVSVGIVVVALAGYAYHDRNPTVWLATAAAGTLGLNRGLLLLLRRLVDRRRGGELIVTHAYVGRDRRTGQQLHDGPDRRR